MSRRYTAQEMRDFADAIAGDLWESDHRGVEYFYDDLIPVIEALRQAADMMERDRQYEYACFNRVFQTLNGARMYAIANEFQGQRPTIVRRSVGEWEEVRDDSCEDR